MPSRRLIAATALLTLHVAVAFAACLSPNGFAEQHRDLPLSPPMKLHWVDEHGRWTLRPFVHPWAPREGLTYREDRARRLPLRFGVERSGYEILGMFPAHRRLLGLDEGEPLFLLGTDSYGRDCLARLLHGGQVSLSAGLLATLVSCALALLLGGLSGYHGGYPDRILMQVSDLFLALPWLYLLFAVRAFLPLDLSPARAFAIIVLLLGGDRLGPARSSRAWSRSEREGARVRRRRPCLRGHRRLHPQKARAPSGARSAFDPGCDLDPRLHPRRGHAVVRGTGSLRAHSELGDDARLASGVSRSVVGLVDVRARRRSRNRDLAVSCLPRARARSDPGMVDEGPGKS